MKMRLLLFAGIMIALPVSSIPAQTYTEIFEGGWASGMKVTRSAFGDLDDDGLLDLLAGVWATQMHRYEQDAPNSTEFHRVTETFIDYDLDFGAPVLIDLDGDGLLDLIVGEAQGRLSHYEQGAAGSESFTLLTESFSGIDVGKNAAPCFTDLDGDGLLDLVVGERDGNLHHYEQDAADPYAFTLKADSLGGADVENFATPCFADPDNDGLIDLIVGDTNGTLTHFEQDAAGSESFTRITDDYNGIKTEGWSAPCFADVDGDGFPDLVLGKDDGNFEMYAQDPAGSGVYGLASASMVGGLIDVGSNCAPCFIDLDGDGRLDMLLGEYDGNVNHWEQDAPGSNRFTRITESFNGIDVGVYSTVFCIDLDGDGLLDLLIGEWNGNLNQYEQDAAGSETFVLKTDNFCGIDVGSGSVPHVGDIDGNGLLDLLVGELDGNIGHYEQDAPGSDTFLLVSENFSGIDVGRRSAPFLTDLTGDGLLDLLVGGGSEALDHYQQEAPGSLDFSLVTQGFMGIENDGEIRPAFADVNADGWLDLMIGSYSGGVRYFQRIPDTHVEPSGSSSVPRAHRLLQAYPNPFNNTTSIAYVLSANARVTIAVYDAQGRRVRTLESGSRRAGAHTAAWDGRDDRGRPVATGIYACRLDADGSVDTVKLLLLK